MPNPSYLTNATSPPSSFPRRHPLFVFISFEASKRMTDKGERGGRKQPVAVVGVLDGRMAQPGFVLEKDRMTFLPPSLPPSYSFSPSPSSSPSISSHIFDSRTRPGCASRCQREQTRPALSPLSSSSSSLCLYLLRGFKKDDRQREKRREETRRPRCHARWMAQPGFVLVKDMSSVPPSLPSSFSVLLLLFFLPPPPPSASSHVFYSRTKPGCAIYAQLPDNKRDQPSLHFPRPHPLLVFVSLARPGEG